MLVPVNKSGLQHSCLSVEIQLHHLLLYFSYVLLTHLALTLALSHKKPVHLPKHECCSEDAF